jgi:hypothetical protein
MNASRMPVHQNRHISNRCRSGNSGENCLLGTVSDESMRVSDDSQSAKPDDIIQESDVIRPSWASKR